MTEDVDHEAISLLAQILQEYDVDLTIPPPTVRKARELIDRVTRIPSASEDYVTICPTALADRYVVVIMKYQGRDEYTQSKVSMAYLRPQAEALAKSWAAVNKLGIR